MSVYDLRYHVSRFRMSHYTNDAEEVLRLVDEALERDSEALQSGAVWVDEGYGDHTDIGDDRTMVTRRTTGLVDISDLRYQVAQRRFDEGVERLRRQGAQKVQS